MTISYGINYDTVKRPENVDISNKYVFVPYRSTYLASISNRMAVMCKYYQLHHNAGRTCTIVWVFSKRMTTRGKNG